MTVQQMIATLNEIAVHAKALPCKDPIDLTRWPNALQQQALLHRVVEAALHAAWALEDYSSKGNQTL